MRRLLAIGVLALVVVAVLVVVLRPGGDEGAYRVRAIFDDAGFAVPGEDVKVAGVKVGTIRRLSVTPQRKAAVVLDIDAPAFQDFRTDATCSIRPQSLIGEQYVECTPTQPRAPGKAKPPALRTIDSGPGKGQRLLPVQQTTTSVALDLVGDTLRMPVRQRLTLIINELGIGVAGRGEDLNAVVRRSAPALLELDKVLKLLASQNRTLTRLAVDSDTILGPLAAKRRNVTGFVTQAQTVAAATAERRAALQASLRRLPTFLAESRPTMRRLGALADELTPVATDLGDQAPAINELIRRLGPFSRAGTPALLSLGDVSKPGIPALRASLPVTRDLRRFATQLRPVGRTLASVLTSFSDNSGLKRLLDYFYFQAQAVNGFDSFGHYLRAGLFVNPACSIYTVTAAEACSANFSNRGDAAAPEAEAAAATATPTATPTPTPRPARTPAAADTATQPTAAARAAAGQASPAADAPSSELLDFLFGKDAP